MQASLHYARVADSPAMERRVLGATFVHGKYMACALFRSYESEQAFADDTMCCKAYLEIVPERTLLLR